MSDLNSILVIGRVTRDGELKYIASGTAVLNFSVAVNRSIPPKDGGEWKNEPTFIDVQAWGKLGEQKAQIVVKGKQVAIAGEIRQERWEKDGVSHSKIYIVAQGIQGLADPRGASGDNPTDGQQSTPRTGKQGPAAQAPSADGFSDDIPF